MKLKVVPLFCAFLSFGNLQAQSENLIDKEKELVLYLDTLRKATTDQAKAKANNNFHKNLKEALQLEGSFSYPFSNLTSVGFIDSPDGLVRIINWNVEQSDESQSYYCFILNNTDKRKGVQLLELLDNSMMMPEQPEEVLVQTDWYGALYYKIIPIKKGSKTIYTLLGWDGATSASNKKLIDALYFVGNQAKLGSPIFKLKDQTVKRIFFEHSEKAVMSLKYEDKYNRIIYDHLSPEAPGLEGFYSFYVPDMSYDALYFNDGKWTLKEDVIGTNSGAQQKTQTITLQDKKTHLPVEKEMKSQWENPEDPNNPNGSFKHTAVTPEDQINKEKVEKEDAPKVNGKDKRDPSQMNSTLGGKKKKRK